MDSVLLTGVLGNSGQYIAEHLINSGVFVYGFDLENDSNKKILKKLLKRVDKSKFKIFWGDITDIESIYRVFDEINIFATIHIAFIIPPFSELKPEMATKVNVDGTRNLVKVMKEKSPDTRMLFSSSVATYGYKDHKEGVVKLENSLSAINNYAQNKIDAERIVKESDLVWTILKFSAVMNPRVSISLESRKYAQQIYPYSKIEPVHVKDVAIAVKNAIFYKNTEFQTYIIAGGKRNQITYGEYITAQVNCFVSCTQDDIPWDQFPSEPYYLHWYDTDYSNEILQYQNRSIDEYLIEFRKEQPLWQRFLAQFMKKRVIRETFGL